MWSCRCGSFFWGTTTDDGEAELNRTRGMVVSPLGLGREDFTCLVHWLGGENFGRDQEKADDGYDADRSG